MSLNTPKPMPRRSKSTPNSTVQGMSDQQSASNSAVRSPSSVSEEDLNVWSVPGEEELLEAREGSKAYEVNLDEALLEYEDLGFSKYEEINHRAVDDSEKYNPKKSTKGQRDILELEYWGDKRREYQCHLPRFAEEISLGLPDLPREILHRIPVGARNKTVTETINTRFNPNRLNADAKDFFGKDALHVDFSGGGYTGTVSLGIIPGAIESMGVFDRDTEMASKKAMNASSSRTIERSRGVNLEIKGKIPPVDVGTGAKFDSKSSNSQNDGSSNEYATSEKRSKPESFMMHATWTIEISWRREPRWPFRKSESRRKEIRGEACIEFSMPRRVATTGD